MDLAEKVAILHLCDKEIIEKFINTERFTLFHSPMPQGIGIATRDDGVSLIATRCFNRGDVVFKNRLEIIPTCDLASNKYLLEVDDKYYLLDNDHHFIHRTNYAEMLGFDSFMEVSYM